MDLAPTAEEALLRAEIRVWLHENLPWEYGKGLPPRFDDLADEVAFGREWQAKLAEGRWVGVGWPRELVAAVRGPSSTTSSPRSWPGRRPELVGRIGVNLVGPDAARARHARTAGRAGCRASSTRRRSGASCSASPAPAATSRRSDHAGDRGRRRLALNGQKVWTSYAQFADWGWCLAPHRSDAPKSKGISALVVDMHAPGVEVRPLRQITDESEFNEVFFSDVFVPADRLVGP